MENIQQQITDWLKSLKGWQSELAYRILNNHDLSDADLQDIISMMKSDTAYDGKEYPNITRVVLEEPITLLSISHVENIEQLAPRNPLTFKEHGITIVYGLNGSGKSGYTRILKKICGKPNGRELIGNIYKPDDNTGKCQISYKCGENTKNIEWKITDKPIDELRAVDIFDTDTGISYIKDSKSTSYIPPAISFFKAFCDCHDTIKSRLIAERDSLKSQLPMPPKDIADSSFIKNEYFAHDIDLTKFTWSDKDESEVSSIEERIRATDPEQKVREFCRKKDKLDSLITGLETDIQKVSQKHYEEIITLQHDAEIKQQAYNDARNALKESAALDGIGAESWKQMWIAAKEYARKEAYKSDVPLYQHERCVLCNQVLDQGAKRRLKTFESFITDKLSIQATQAIEAYETSIKDLPQQPNKDAVNDQCTVCGLNLDFGAQIYQIKIQIFDIGDAIRKSQQPTSIPRDIYTALSALRHTSSIYAKQIEQYRKDALSFDKPANVKRLLELKARKWCTEQIEFLKKEKEIQEQISMYDKWITAINTHGITTKANEIGNAIITQAYADRFNNELQNLGVNHIRIGITSRSAKGSIQHSLIIANDEHYQPNKILSEGEARIISLAAFLADVTGGNQNNPFIFDDPISSLDQEYEEKTVARLVELSKTRQVIVFTHRISLMCQLEAKAKSDVTIHGIKREYWGTGEIGCTPLNVSKPIKSLNRLKTEDIPQARKTLNNEGSDKYYPKGKMLCSEFRTIIERTVETNLLSDIVQRYRREIKTNNMLKRLLVIDREDCILIEDLMTKYSRYEHSQPEEAPVEIPTPDEIEADVNKLLQWIDGFKKKMQ